MARYQIRQDKAQTAILENTLVARSTVEEDGISIVSKASKGECTYQMDRGAIAAEYAALFVLPTLDEHQEQQMEEFLLLASKDKQLDCKLAEVDLQCGAQMGLLDEAHCHSYENQKSFLREYLGASLPRRCSHLPD